MDKGSHLAQLTARIFTPGAMDDADIARWRDMMAANPILATPFLSHAYAAAAERAYGGVHVCQIENEGNAVAFFPFQFPSATHRLLGLAERVGANLCDHFGIIGELGFAVRPHRLLSLARLTTMSFTHLDESQAHFGLTGELPKVGLRIEFPDGPDPYWEARRRLDKDFVADTRRRERKLVEKYGKLRFVFREQEPLPHLERLIAAKRAQYARTGVTDVIRSRSVRHFLRELALSSDPDCRAALSTLYAGDTWVASHFGLTCGKTLHYWFPVYNFELRSHAPGRLLLKAIIDESKNLGVTCVDRGAGDTPAKRSFATSQYVLTEGLWSRPGFTALAYRSSLSLTWRLGRLRRLLLDRSKTGKALEIPRESRSD